MNDYYAMLRLPSEDAAFLEVDYDIQEVNPADIEQADPLPEDFLEHFAFRLNDGVLEDIIDTGIGWNVVSNRFLNFLGKIRNQRDIRLLELPESLTVGRPDLLNYKLLGVKRSVFCLHKTKSEVRWSKANPMKFATTIYKGFIDKSLLPPELDMFRLAESSPYKMISSEIVHGMVHDGLRGFKWERFPVV